MKEVKPRLRPSQKPKKRYILFRAEKGSQFNSIKALVQEMQLPSLWAMEFSPKTGFGILRCERSISSKLREALSGKGLAPIKTSGSIKKLRSML